MSHKASNAVWQESQAVGAARLVLLALADVAADNGEISAYARSHRSLAAKAKIDERTVRKAIHQLEDLGELTVVSQGAGRVQSNYLINLPSLQRGREGPSQSAGSTGPSEGARDPVSPAPRAPQPGSTGQAIIPSLSVLPPSSDLVPSDPARDLVKFAWKARETAGKPRPTIRGDGSAFMALVVLARKLLENDHDPEVIALAIVDHEHAWTNDSLLNTIGQVKKGRVSDPKLAAAIRDRAVMAEFDRLKAASNGDG